MKKLYSTKIALSLIVISLYVSSCAVNPTCPGNLLPIVEIQINNTASTHDDYITTRTSVSCRARITNVNGFVLSGTPPQNFPGGVEVEVRNRSLSTALNIATTSGGSGSAFFATLPGDGSWFNFFIRGTAISTIDKSVILEIATAGASCNEVVLDRKGLMVTTSPPILSTLPKVEIEVGSVSNLDDYITWSPTGCRIKWANPTGTGPLNITLRNMPSLNRLRFSSTQPAVGTTATNSTDNLSLPSDGSWVNFYVAGNNGNASIDDKDAVFEVLETSSSNLLAREGIMVRIRKNANASTFTTAERDRYLEALKKINLPPYNDYIDFVKTHSRDNTGAGGSTVAHIQAHSGSAFLAWHRAFILHIERLLQAADPSVALPYWKFDVNAPNIFTQDFMGINSAGNMATLSVANPIVSWSLSGEGVPTGIQRKTPYGDGGHPGVATETATLGLGSPGFSYASFKAMEVSEHNPAHSTSGFVNPGTGQPVAGASWIGGSPAIAPRDPLFFFLHCNVDRLWAKWQWLRTRYNVTDVLTYDLQGSHATPGAGIGAPCFTQNAVTGQITCNRTLGQYADDTMWPWDNVTGGTGTAARPNIAILTPFPIVVGAILPGNKPTVKGVIDYINITGSSGISLGFGYDDFFPY